MNVKNKTILIVEDDEIITLTEKSILEKYGYKIITANTGEKAVEIFSYNENIDLILMDIDLGDGIDGTETAAIILKERDIPVVFLSSHTEPEVVEKTEKITSYGYVVKSSSNTVLDASIKMAFKLFEANQKISASNESLRHHSQLLENVIENLPGFVIWKDTNSIFLGCNSNFALRCGISSPAELIGKSDYDLPFHEDEVKSFLEDDRKVMQEGVSKLNFEEREHVADGEEIFLQTSKIPLYDADGQISGILAVALDITARKHSELEIQIKNEELKSFNEKLLKMNEELLMKEKALRESEERYRSLIQNSMDIIFRTDSFGKFIFVNVGVIQITGFEEKEIIGRHFSELIRPDKVNEVNNLLVDQMKNRIKNTYCEFPIISKDKHEIWVGQNTQLTIDNDNVSGFQGVVRNLTNAGNVLKQ